MQLRLVDADKLIDTINADIQYAEEVISDIDMMNKNSPYIHEVLAVRKNFITLNKERKNLIDRINKLATTPIK